MNKFYPRACYAMLCAFNGLMDFYFADGDFLLWCYTLRLKMCEIGFIPRALFKAHERSTST